PDATIYYSINGVVYTYNALDFPLAIYHTSTINWWAEYTVADPDYFSSEVQSFFISVKNRTRMTYWGGGNNSVFNPPAGTYQTPQDVYINTLTDPINAPIYYSLDGGTTYQLYNGGAIHVAASQMIEVYADPMPVLTTLESLHQTAAYNITGTLPTPIIAPDGYPDVSMYEADVNVSITLPVGDPRWAAATIYYTTDGSVPNATSSVYAGTIPLGQGHWYVNAIAILPTWINSAVATTQYMVKFLPPVTFMPSAIEHTSAINVQMYAYGAAQIRYTDDGSEPNGSSAVYDPLNPPSLTIDNNGRYSRTYKAKANLVGWITSETAEKTYTMIPTVPDPVITANIPGLVHATPIDVTITDLLAGVQIYYTLDGSDPSDTSTPYAGTFTLTTTTTVRAIAYKAGFETSQIVEIAYTIGNNIGALVFQPASATYYNPIDVTISTNPPAAQIYYTKDGSLPVVVGGVPQGTTEQYVGAIHLGYSPVSVTINAIAVLASWTDNTGSAIYRVTDTLTSPSIVPATSQYAVGTTVPVTITAPNGDIWYRVNGAAWQSYAGAFDVSSAVSGTITVEAKADVTDASWLASSITTAVYTFNGQLNAPIITPLAGTYSTGIMVKMLNYQDATIYYSIDNGVTYNEYTFGSVGFAVNENTTVKAYAVKANWQNSPVVTSVYSFKVPNPVFDRLSGSFDLPFDASLSVISGDPIYYTVNGSDPIMSNPNAFPYVNPIAVGYGYTRIRAMAHRANWISSDIVEVIYNVNGQLQTPVFSLMGGLYQDPQTVSISANPSNANIYYTTDGTEPDESSALYAGAISITEITTLKAKAYLATWVPSNVASADYDLQVKAITSTPPPNVFTVTQFITLQTATPGTIIRFTTDGSVPGIGSSIYSGAIEVSSNTRIRAIAYKNDGLNWLPSAEYDQTYSISQQVATPVLNLPGGVYTYAPVTVNITCATAGAAISYSYDGVNWLPYTIPLLVNETKMIYAKAEKLDWLTSNVNPAYYIISIPIVATPVFADQAGVYSLPGTYNNAVDVKITTSTPGAQIYYTLNGNDPTEADSHYLAPFTISATTIVKARAYSAPMIASGILTGEYRIEPLTVLSPIVIPEDDSNPFYESFYVYMFPRTTDSVIRYTTNGAEPTGTDAEYTTPVLINATTVIKAKAFKSGFESVTVTRNYVITGKVNIANVSLTPAAGNYSTLQTISSVGALNPVGAVLRYTTNGTDPIATSPLFGSLNPPLGSSLNLKVRGFKTNWLPSDVLSASYTFTGQVVLAANLFSLDPAPIYTQSQTITLNTVTTPIGATLRWTSDGSEPSQLSPAYISGQQIQIPSTTTIKVKGFFNGWADSIVKTATYTITGKVLLGTMLPDAGTFQNAQAISLGATVPADASVYYTTNGTDPTTASALYNNAAFNIDANDVINGSADVIVKVKGFKTNWDASTVLSRTYTFQAATPMFNVASGLYPDAQNLVLTTTTVGGVIHYTTDGSVPTLVSPTYVNPLLISSSVTVKARAFNGDYLPSTIASATYVIGTNQLVALPTFTPAAGTYATAQTIQINCATPGATIYYRTDGLDPTNFDTPFVAGIVVPLNTTVTIKARAYKDGFIASQVATATFVITNKVAPVVFN
ncbi:MAG: chitobiase/beta-hexosaminidase C-terminal domain-containing protein, partial [Candidatus Cloacimonetes bacterium]|nr:chitobiase/beta-hexosaminidase C-terminal domain-containing protein [Candidatus Cloacimonadota bacterium]